MNKLIKVTVFIGLFFSISFSANAALSDSYDSIHEGAINYLYDQGIVGGYPDGSFKPHNLINRAELLKIVIGAAAREGMQNISVMESFAGSSCFSDVPAYQWYTKYICYAKSVDIIIGYPDGTYKPEQNITLPEAEKIMLKSFGRSYTNTDPWYNGIFDSMGFYYKAYDRIADLLVQREVMADLLVRALADNQGKLDDYLNGGFVNGGTSGGTGGTSTVSLIGPNSSTTYTTMPDSISFTWTPSVTNAELWLDTNGDSISNGGYEIVKKNISGTSYKLNKSEYEGLVANNARMRWYLVYNENGTQKNTAINDFYFGPNVITLGTTVSLIGPNSSTTYTTMPDFITFQWTPSLTNAELWLDTNGDSISNGGYEIVKKNISGTSYKLNKSEYEGLVTNNARMRWFISYTENGTQKNSATNDFYFGPGVITPGITVTLNYPKSNTTYTTMPDSINFTWTPSVTNAELWLDTNGDGLSGGGYEIVKYNISGTSYKLYKSEYESKVANNAQMRWFIRYYDNGVKKDTSYAEFYWGSGVVTTLSKPQLLYPPAGQLMKDLPEVENNGGFISGPVRFSWSNVGAAYYNLYFEASIGEGDWWYPNITTTYYDVNLNEILGCYSCSWWVEAVDGYGNKIVSDEALFGYGAY